MDKSDETLDLSEEPAAQFPTSISTLVGMAGCAVILLVMSCA